MRIICDQAELSRFLQIVSRAISTKNTLAILTGILLETKNQALRCVATDLEIAIEVFVPNIQIIEEGVLVVPGKTFVEIIRHLPFGAVTISKETAANIATVCGNNSSFQLPVLPPEEFPLLPEGKENVCLTVNGSLFREAVRHTVYATLADDPRPFVSSILWEITPDRLRMVATDINRLAVRDLPLNGEFQGNAVVPVRALREIAAIFGNNDEENLEISISDRIIFFKEAGVAFSSRLVETQFPRYEQVIPREFHGTFISDREHLIAALERSFLVSNSVRLKMTNQKLLITAKEPDKGNSYEELPIDLSGNDFEIGFNIRFLLDFLKVAETEKIIFKYNEEQKPVLLQGEGRNDYLYIVMPLKISV